MRSIVLGSVTALLFTACSSSTPPPQNDVAPPAVMTTPAAAAATQPMPAPKARTPDPKTAMVRVLAVSDFHGWLLPLEPKNYSRYFGGIANMGGMFRHKELATDADGLGTMLLSFYLPIIFLLLLLYFLFRHQIKAAGKGAMSFGKSKAKMMTMDKGKVTFKDVAGVEEAKEEVWEIWGHGFNVGREGSLKSFM